MSSGWSMSAATRVISKNAWAKATIRQSLSSGLNKAGLCVIEHGLNLFATHTWEPFEKFRHRGSAFKISEECFYRNARADEKPDPADLAGNPLHRRAL